MNRQYTPYNLDYAALYGVPVAAVDAAIDFALDSARLEDGWSGIPDLNPLIWNRIGTTVENYLSDEYNLIGYEDAA